MKDKTQKIVTICLLAFVFISGLFSGIGVDRIFFLDVGRIRDQMKRPFAPPPQYGRFLPEACKIDRFNAILHLDPEQFNRVRSILEQSDNTIKYLHESNYRKIMKQRKNTQQKIKGLLRKEQIEAFSEIESRIGQRDKFFLNYLKNDTPCPPRKEAFGPPMLRTQ